MRKMIFVLPILVSGCATVFNSEPKMVYANGNSEETFTLTRNGMPMQKNITLPMTLGIPNGWADYALRNNRGEFCPIGQTVNGATLINLLWWPGFIIDALTGDMVRAKGQVYCDL